jgi:hypothetical protein
MIIDTTFQKLNLLVNLCVYSTRVHSLIIKQRHGDFNLRPQVHVIIHGISGTTKSTIIKQVGVKTGVIPLTHITSASLVGGIDKETKQTQVGLAWVRRNNVIPLDEVSFNMNSTRDKDVLDALLQIMENQEYSKRISMFISPVKEIEGDLFFIAEKGQIDVKTRVSFILGTMFDMYNIRSLQLIALISRCVPFDLEMNQEDIDNISQGKKIYTDMDFRPKKKVIIPLKDYERILAYAKNYNCHKDIFLRTIGDMCRAYAVMGEHDDAVYNLIIFLKNEFTWVKK